MSDADKVETLVRLMRDPNTDESTRLDCATKLLDMADPEVVAELAREITFDLLEALKEHVRATTDPEVRRLLGQQIDEIELARLAYIQRLADD